MFFFLIFFFKSILDFTQEEIEFFKLDFEIELEFELTKMFHKCYVPKYFLKSYYLANFAVFFPYGLWVLLCQLKNLNKC